MKKSRKGWIRLIEVFVSIALIMSLVTVLISVEDSNKDSITKEIYNQQNFLIKKIQLNESLREDILNKDISSDINNTINSTMSNYLDCQIKICEESCSLEKKKEIYALSGFISNSSDFREFRVFCWYS